MKVKCDKCKNVFSIRNALVKEEGRRFRCSQCGNLITIHPEPEKESPVPPPIFTIIEDRDCPLYTLEDEFQLSGGDFLVPSHKAPCLILARDVRYILQEESGEEKPETPFKLYECSGCTGRIRFIHKARMESRNHDYTEQLTQYLGTFSIFEGLEKSEIKDIVSYLRIDRFNRGDLALRKGEAGRNLFIILSGSVHVLSEDGLPIAAIGNGEVFGEMSILSGSMVGASVQVAESTTLLRIGADHFKKILKQFPSLQMSFTRLLVKRMAEINAARSEQFSSNLAGKISELPPPDLFQTFNINQKTGVLTLRLPNETAQLSFREGRLVDVEYGNKKGEEAFFELLKLKRGRFKYFPGLSPEKMQASEIGDFMFLIIEGLRRIEQDDREFLRTVIPTLV